MYLTPFGLPKSPLSPLLFVSYPISNIINKGYNLKIYDMVMSENKILHAISKSRKMGSKFSSKKGGLVLVP